LGLGIYHCFPENFSHAGALLGMEMVDLLTPRVDDVWSESCPRGTYT